ncbi:pyrophosphate-energized membrane proton pump 2-like [Musa acuminata AAA Group]|uniref:pyrophosphate-energized membrane proton pump 2-like n=1 Tax=Musa acuminata AAA Group TaxID=214697 RepID=UPI0031E12C17
MVKGSSGKGLLVNMVKGHITTCIHHWGMPRMVAMLGPDHDVKPLTNGDYNPHRFSPTLKVGTVTAYAFVWITKYYTDSKHEAVRVLAHSSAMGHGTNIIASLVDETGNPTGGLFGIAVGTMGMLSTDAYVLTMDMFGPVADNAGGGIMEMSQQPESVWEITDVLDAVRNTTKAITKGFAIGSAALATFLLSSAIISLLNSAFACSAVGRTAQEVNNEVRRQFIERPGIMVSSPTSHVRESQTTFAIVVSASLQEMIKPGAWATISPVVIGVLGLFFRLLGHYTGQQLLGAKVVALMLMFATVVGILLALFLNTAGSAWDNSKKYIETGALGRQS